MTISGGKAPYALKWSDNVSGNPAFDNGKVNLSNLVAGAYNVEVKDVAGGIKTISLNIEEPKLLTAIALSTKSATTNAKDGEAEVNVEGGSGKYTYQWDTGENKSKAVKLGAGSHQVTITDEANCTAVAGVEITEDILDLTVSLKQTSEIKCAGESTGALSVEVNGGKPPYVYNWSDATFKGDKISNLSDGDYSVEVKDASGKGKVASFKMEAPEKLSAIAKATNMATVGKENGTAEVTAAGGSGKYSYAWDNGSTGKQVDKLSPGEHTVTITDATGCSAVASISISENVLELGATITQTNAIQCNGENQAALKVELLGGKGPYQFKWSNNALTGDAPSNVGAGSYTVEITDAKDNTTNASIEVKEPLKLEASITVEAPATTGKENGKATVQVKGGEGRYTYAWDNGESAATAIKLGPGQIA